MYTFPTGCRRAQARGYGYKGHLRGLGKLFFYEPLATTTKAGTQRVPGGLSAKPRITPHLVVVRLMLHRSSPLQRALLHSAAALAPRDRRTADVQHVFDHYTLRHISFQTVLQSSWHRNCLFICAAKHTRSGFGMRFELHVPSRLALSRRVSSGRYTGKRCFKLKTLRVRAPPRCNAFSRFERRALPTAC